MKLKTFAARAFWWRLFFSLTLLVVAGAGVLQLDTSRSDSVALSETKSHSRNDASQREAKKLSYQVVQSYPHDPRAFLQGWLWHDGGFYESTGLNGQSSLRRVEFPSGRVLRIQPLPQQFFGEGLVLFDNRLIQLTWQSNTAFIYDRDTFKPLGTYRYEGEGWGITTDGQQLIMSDGSDALTFRNPQDFEPQRQLRVTMNGRPLDRLNELEYVEGQIWANVWQTDRVVQIDPQSGAVVSYLDLTGLLASQWRRGGEDVLNGIAYDAQAKRIFVCGKNWPRLFEIERIR